MKLCLGVTHMDKVTYTTMFVAVEHVGRSLKLRTKIWHICSKMREWQTDFVHLALTVFEQNQCSVRADKKRQYILSDYLNTQ